MDAAEIHNGIVKIFYPLKGFGFITRKKGRDIFFHYRDIVTSGADSNVLEGDQVEFVIGSRDDKPRALQVRKIG